MICRILHLQSEQEWVKASQWLDGRFNPGDSVEGSVREILANVREKGDEALIDYTRRFDLPADDTDDTREILSQVYNSLQQKGYNPINQIVGYILSEDPTYITNFNNARTLIRKLDRDELLQELVRYYLDV